MDILGVIPARFSSTRFPGKPLELIDDKPMIQHVYERCLEAQCFEKVVVATDDQRIVDVVNDFGGDVFMTDASHQSGTDRCFEVFNGMNYKFDAIINVQGDEPFLSPTSINTVADLLKQEASIATLAVEIDEGEHLFDHNKVKVVLNKNSEAMYFSREALPFQRDAKKDQWLKNQKYFLHLGVYGFSSPIISEIESLVVSDLERMECLEQLRWLENGLKIKVGIVDEAPRGVDTPEDLVKLNELIKSQK